MIDHHHPGVFALNRALRAGKPLRQCIEVVRDTLTADDLRNTPAGRALMAEAWQEGAMAHAEATGHLTPGARRIINETMLAANPYKETPNE